MLKGDKKNRKNVFRNNLAACILHHKAMSAAEVLNFCVRDGNRCDHFAIATRSFFSLPKLPEN